MFITNEYTQFKHKYNFSNESIAWSCFSKEFIYRPSYCSLHLVAQAFLASLNVHSYKDFIIFSKNYDFSSMLSILIHKNPHLSSHDIMLIFKTII